MMRRFGILFVVLLSACAMPATNVRSTDTRPSLAFEGAPPGATVYVDGILVGNAESFDGHPGVLLVEPGTHQISVKTPEGAILFQRRIFIESEIKTIKVH